MVGGTLVCVGLLVGVADGLSVGVGVGVGVEVDDIVGVGVGVSVSSNVAVGDTTGVKVGVLGRGKVAVGVGVSAWAKTGRSWSAFTPINPIPNTNSDKMNSRRFIERSALGNIFI